MKLKNQWFWCWMIMLVMALPPPALALSARHHLYNMGRNLIGAVTAPVHGVFVRGPQNIRDTYHYEVWGREDVEMRGKWRYRFFAFWRAPGDELKGIIDGSTDSVKHLGDFMKSFLSIFFSD